jgi:ribonuclease D
VTASPPPPPVLIAHDADLAPVVEAALAASLLSVDVEGNGLFAYRARLCTVQLAWDEDGATRIAIIDTLAVDPKPLGQLLGPAGPLKVLHDFTFDVKLLAESGVELANVRDTSVLARMLGRQATGLGSLLATELGLIAPKALQQHDWTRRPLGPAELDYLATDVRHLAALYDKLSAEAHALDIHEEVLDECAFKYEMALAPPREKRPAYLRIRGADALDAAGLAVLRRLVQEREEIAASWNQPPFKVVSNDTLLVLAAQRPTTVEQLRRARKGVSGRLMQFGDRLVDAIRRGLEDGEAPAADRMPPVRLEKSVVAARRAREKRLSGWRRAEAKARGVDEQVVLPGHCLSDLVAGAGDAAAIATVKGLGARRLARYGAVLEGLLADRSGDVEGSVAVEPIDPEQPP